MTTNARYELTSTHVFGVLLGFTMLTAFLVLCFHRWAMHGGESLSPYVPPTCEFDEDASADLARRYRARWRKRKVHAH